MDLPEVEVETVEVRANNIRPLNWRCVKIIDRVPGVRIKGKRYRGTYKFGTFIPKTYHFKNGGGLYICGGYQLQKIDPSKGEFLD